MQDRTAANPGAQTQHTPTPTQVHASVHASIALGTLHAIIYAVSHAAAVLTAVAWQSAILMTASQQAVTTIVQGAVPAPVVTEVQQNAARQLLLLNTWPQDARCSMNGALTAEPQNQSIKTPAHVPGIDTHLVHALLWLKGIHCTLVAGLCSKER